MNGRIVKNDSIIAGMMRKITFRDSSKNSFLSTALFFFPVRGGTEPVSINPL
jgi:hypothetical protein